MRGLVLFALLLSCLAAPSARAEEAAPSPAELRVTVIDQTGGALVTATVTVTDAGGVSRQVHVDGKGAVVITHGYAEHCGRYREVAHVIVNAGWAALAYDVRGHGHSPGPRGYIEHFDIYLDDFRAACAAAKQLAPGAPLVVLGAPLVIDGTAFRPADADLFTTLRQICQDIRSAA